MEGIYSVEEEGMYGVEGVHGVETKGRYSVGAEGMLYVVEGEEMCSFEAENVQGAVVEAGEIHIAGAVQNFDHG